MALFYPIHSLQLEQSISYLIKINIIAILIHFIETYLYL